MTVSMSINGFMSSPSALRAWSAQSHENIRRGVAREMRGAQSDLKKAATNAVAGVFRVSRGSFPKSWRTRVYDEKRNQLPAVLVQSRIFWMGAQEHGATISGKRGQLIPFGGLRIGYKAWKKLVNGLRATGNTFFRSIGGKLILFARSGGRGSRLGARFKSMTVSGIPAMRKLKSGEAYPIAVLVRSVRLRARYSLGKSVAPIVRQMARRISAAVTI